MILCGQTHGAMLPPEWVRSIAQVLPVRFGGGKALRWALIAQSAVATYCRASREGFMPRQPALTGNGGE